MRGHQLILEELQRMGHFAWPLARTTRYSMWVKCVRNYITHPLCSRAKPANRRGAKYVPDIGRRINNRRTSLSKETRGHQLILKDLQRMGHFAGPLARTTSYSMWVKCENFYHSSTVQPCQARQ